MKDSKQSHKNRISRNRDTSPYAALSGSHRNLIDSDPDSRATIAHIMRSLDDIAKGRFSKKSILDIAEES